MKSFIHSFVRRETSKSQKKSATKSVTREQRESKLVIRARSRKERQSFLRERERSNVFVKSLSPLLFLFLGGVFRWSNRLGFFCAKFEKKIRSLNAKKEERKKEKKKEKKEKKENTATTDNSGKSRKIVFVSPAFVSRIRRL